jgi:hypothetical protein
MSRQFEDDDEKGGKAATDFKEFDCPGCNANNPCDPPFREHDEVLCNYCGSQYEVWLSNEGRMRLREI